MPWVDESVTTETLLTNGLTTNPPETANVPPIAVIGLAGRFPGEATDASALWKVCCEGRSAWSEIPEDRFSSRAYRHSNPSKSGCFNSRGACFLKEDVGLFDATFFGISPLEAKAMDPQQRLLLETTYEAMENAGITLEGISGHSTGVYVGASQIDYTILLQRDTQEIPLYQSTGTSANILSNRISYIFNLKGPSFTVDTACSSSLVALHTACQALRLREIDQAIVCGAHIMLSPDTMVGMSMLRLFGDEGRSYSYDSRATGYGRGEGVVSLILKPLEKAILDGDNIRAVIRNTGINQDGKTAGITFPSCDAQASLIKSVYEAAGIDPRETDYVEAHGTGTAAGDPVEAEAIARSLTKNRALGNPLIVGSVKSNIGHLEAASGLAAVVKTVMALEEDVIPPNFDFQFPNKDIPLDEWNIKVPTFVQPWPNRDIQRASISNFGFGGTNVHVILEKYKGSNLSSTTQVSKQSNVNGDIIPTNLDTPTNLDANGYHTNDSATSNHMSKSHITRNGINAGPQKRRLYVISANDKASLKMRSKRLSSYLEQRKNVDPELLAFTLNERRSQLEWRAAVSAVTSSELGQILNDDQAEYARPSEIPKLGFIFTGQGAQWANMGMELLSYPVFARTLHQADNILTNMGAEWSLLDELAKDSKPSRIGRPFLSQPATTAIQIALVDLLSTWNVTPTAVVGHSSGEIAAAYAAGALSLPDCMLIAYHRGFLAESLKERRPDRPGGMLAVGASPAHVRPMLTRLGSAHAVVACVNAPSLITVSGDERAMARLQPLAEEEGLLNRRLKVDVAYHSPHMKDIATQYLESISSVVVQPQSEVLFHSSVKGRLVDTSILTPNYWVENMISPVQFLNGVQSMYAKVPGPDVLIELGPHSTLEAPLRAIMKAHPSWSSGVRYCSTLVRNKDAVMTALSLAASLHVLGANLDLSAVNQVDHITASKVLPDLPAYPWNHSKRHWHESRLSVNHRQKQFPRSDLLGLLVDDFNMQELRWRNILRLADLPWLVDHNVQGSIIFPLTGYLAMAFEAFSQYVTLHNISTTNSTSYRLREIQVGRSIVLSEETPTEISFVLRPRDEGTRNSSRSWQQFTVYSWTPDNGWAEHCHGLIRLIQEDGESNAVSGPCSFNFQKDHYESIISSYRSTCQETMDPAKIYNRLKNGGIAFGPAFRNIIAARVTLDHSIGTVLVPDTRKEMPYEEENICCIHPRTFDSCFQVTDFATDEAYFSNLNIYVPTFVEEITVKHQLHLEPGQELHVYAQKHRPLANDDMESHASFIVASSDNASDILIDVRDAVGSRLPRMSIDNFGDRNLCYEMKWVPYTDLLSPTQLTAALSASDINISPRPQIENLERAAHYYIQRLLDALPADEIDQSLPHLRKLYAAISLLHTKAQDGALPFPTRDWLRCNEEERIKFLAESASADECGRLLAAIGENLIPIFLEEVEPLTIMLHDNKLEKYHRNDIVMLRGYESEAAVTSHLARQNPNMTILEIGAGTGGATTRILHGLGLNFARYDFTDVSPRFFDSAKQEQTEWSGKIDYRRLNIEDDPSAQGFDLESYDLVIASSVLHATKNIRKTMDNIRSLLRPGGKVVIAEATQQLCSTAMIFGCLPGWWLGEEPERQGNPLLDDASWDEILKSSGFSGIDASVPLNPEGPSTASVLLATAVLQQSPSYPEVSIIAHGESHEHLSQAVSEEISMLTKPSSTPVNELLQVELDDRCGIFLALDEPFWSDIDETTFKKMQQIISSARGILWVSRGARGTNPTTNLISGFARSIRGENAGIRLVNLDLDAQQPLAENQLVDLVIKVFQASFGSDGQPKFFDDFEFAEINGVLHVPRIYPDLEKDKLIVRETGSPRPEAQNFYTPGRPLKLKIGQVGLLDSMYFEEDTSIAAPIDANDIEIRIAATGLNFKDLMISLGQIPFYHNPGIEVAGTITSIGSDVSDFQIGDRVCALGRGCYANLIRTPQQWVAKVPQEMTYTYAASIPVIFATAHYSLSHVGRLCSGESILIHAAAGGVGQAAIMLAHRVKAEVFVTVSSIEKKELLMKTYGIAEDHIFSSRDTFFYKIIMTMTNQRGVDVVLNSTSGDVLHHSWQCLAPLGRFIELGKRDIVQNTNLEMRKFAESTTFTAFDLGVLSEKQPRVFQRILQEVVDMHTQKALQPVTPTTIMPISDLQQAMRLMQAGKHTGKIVIEADADCTIQALPAPSAKAINRSDASYLITGGTGGLGRSITRWLAAKEGAKNIILASRSGLDQAGVYELVEELRALDVHVHVERCDVSDEAQVKRLISVCQETMPPIRGVIHGAMALRDFLFEKGTHSDWSMNIKPRVNGAWNLHNALLDMELDFFVMLASASGIIGRAGQSAYGASNTFLDSFAVYRNQLGLPASSIDIGLVEGVGYVAEADADRLAEIITAGHDQTSEAELHALVKAAMTNPLGRNSFQHTLTGFKLHADKELPTWARDPKFVHVLRAIQTSSRGHEQKKDLVVRQQLKQAETMEAAARFICEALSLKISGLLMMAVEDIDAKKPVVAYGLDSLAAVELRNWITGELEATVPLMELMNSPSIGDLSGLIAMKSRLVDRALVSGSGETEEGKV